MPRAGLDKPALVIACHIGSTPLHVVFALLQLTALFWPATRRHAPLRVIGVPSFCSILAASYHAVMILACEPSSFSEALHAYWETDSFTRLRMAWGLIGGVSLAWSACWCIRSGTGRFKTARMAAVSMLALASACLACWAWSTTGPISDIWGHRPFFQICNRIVIFLSWVFILTEARSANMWYCTYLAVGCAVSGPIVRTVYYPACVNAVHSLLSCVSDTAHPHWPAIVFFGLEELAFLIMGHAVSGTMGHTRKQPATPLPTRTPRLLQGVTLKHVAIAGTLVALLVSVGVPIVASWLSSSEVFFAELTQQSRELLSMYSKREVRAYVCTHVRMCTHTCLCAFMHACMHARALVCECTCVRACARVCRCARVRLCLCGCARVCQYLVCACLCVPVCVCVCVCV